MRIRRSKKAGFTFIELMMVITVIGLVAAVIVPRIGLTNPPLPLLLQRSIEEASLLASKGGPVRICVVGRRLVAERQELLKSDEQDDPVYGWRKVPLQWLPGGDEWREEGTCLLIHSDESCSPGRLIYGTGKDRSVFLISVTGNAYEISSKR